MKWLADEHIGNSIVARLRRDGHEVVSVSEDCPGVEDDVILARAQNEGALVLTADKDFSELIFRQHRATQGVVLLRLTGLSEEAKAGVVAAAVAQFGDAMRENFTVIEPGVCRLRRRVL